MKRLFGGTLTNQIISKECGHLSEREESFYTLSLEIKNKKNIQVFILAINNEIAKLIDSLTRESLDLYVQGDVLEGDNKYFCGQCSAKVDAIKRCCIKELPNTLIIHLKRFEFDLETMRRIKLNDFCEFPTRLNMEAYTKVNFSITVCLYSVSFVFASVNLLNRRGWQNGTIHKLRPKCILLNSMNTN